MKGFHFSSILLLLFGKLQPMAMGYSRWGSGIKAKLKSPPNSSLLVRRTTRGSEQYARIRQRFRSNRGHYKHTSKHAMVPWIPPKTKSLSVGSVKKHKRTRDHGYGHGTTELRARYEVENQTEPRGERHAKAPRTEEAETARERTVCV